MRELFILVAHLPVTLAKLARPGGLGAVAAESLAVKQQFAHHEASAAPCSETDLIGSAGAGRLYTFRLTPTSAQDGGDTAAFQVAGLSPRLGEAQVSTTL